jgi:IclR family transcriptional regulator, acetate operon repressor
MVQSVERTLDILELLASLDDDVALSQVAERLDLPLGTVHRLLATLIARGYAAQDAATRLYGPGPKLLEIAARAAESRRFSLQHVAQPFLQQLVDATGETSNLLSMQGDEAVYLAQATSPRLVRMFTQVGQRAPLYCTGGGKALLAGLPLPEFERYLRRVQIERWTPYTLPSPDALRQDVMRIREHGFAVDHEEREEGVRCVAAPIFDHSGACVGALSISGPTTRVTPDLVATLGPQVRAAAQRCSATLGFRLHTRETP